MSAYGRILFNNRFVPVSINPLFKPFNEQSSVSNLGALAAFERELNNAGPVDNVFFVVSFSTTS